MRKVLSVLLLASLLFGIGTNAFAAEKETDEDKAMALIAKTNNKISEEIIKAIDKAEKLRAEYLSDVTKLEEKEMVSLLDAKYLVGLDANQSEEETIEIVEEKIFLVEDNMLVSETNHKEKLILLEQETNTITTLLVAEENKDDTTCPNQEQVKEESVCDKYKKLTDRYEEQLSIIITNLQEKAVTMSTNTIVKVLELGLEAECVFVKVRIGHKYVWVDPIRIVGI